MKKQKCTKGEFEYPKYQTKKVIITTIIFFLISASIFAFGYFLTKTTSNLWTIIAVLGMLPVSKSLVSVIMYLRIPDFNYETYTSISEKSSGMSVLYSLYLTSYNENFPINCFIVKSNTVIGYTEFSATQKKICNIDACEEHIKIILKQNSFKNVTVKIFTDLDKFLNRAEQLKNIEANNNENEVINLLCDISL